MLKVVQKLAEKLGVSLIPTWRLQNYQLAEHLNNLFSLYNIDCVLDIGANIGQYGKFIRHAVGYSGVILSFEPVKSTFDHLLKASQFDNHWHCLNYAFGDFDGTSDINISHASVLSSFLKPSAEFTSYSVKDKRTVQTETVKITTLDQQYATLVADYAFSRPYLKMDTQGYDLAVLKGGKSTVTHEIIALQTELSFIPIYERMPKFDAMTNQLREYGYSFSGIFPVATDASMRLIEADGIFVQDSEVPLA